MQTTQSSRRLFLTNLALLTAGTVWGNAVPRFFPEKRVIPSPECTWKSICALYKGYPGETAPRVKKTTPLCKGHVHREGALIYFPAEKIKAQPLWIYWANNNRPSDLLVHFYKHDDSVITLNLYELQAMLHRGNTAQKKEQQPLAALLKVNEGGKPVRIAQTSVYRNKIKTVYLS